MRFELTAKTQFILLLSLAIYTFFVYSPGLSGDFLLDDFYTLRPLGLNLGIDSGREFWNYVVSGTSGPTGRPLAMLTFALNAQNWPADPKPFLITNVVIHCFNAVMVYWFVYYLVKVHYKQKDAFYLSLFIAAIWAIHPFQVSSVLYIVQRMTLMSGFFTLGALIVYLNIRLDTSPKFTTKLYLKLSLIAFLSVLALLSKETGILIPAYMVIVEFYLRLSKAGNYKAKDKFVLACAALGSTIILAYLAKYLTLHLFGVKIQGVAREFTMYERFITEFRILGDYLIDIFIPKIQTAGVFHDNYLVSKNLFSPFSTIIWMFFHLGLIIFSILIRNRLPVLTFSILWFYCSHILESSFLMLELKFEHRNYLALLSVAMIVGFAIFNFINTARIRKVCIFTTFIVLSVTLWVSSSLWGKPVSAALIWIEQNPNSPRALENAASKIIDYGGAIETSKSYMRRLVDVRPTATSEIKYIAGFCETYNGLEPNWSALAVRVSNDPRNWSLHQVIIDLVDSTVSGQCDIAGYEDLLALIEGYRKNTVYKGQKTVLTLMEAEYKLALFFQDEERVREIEYSHNLYLTSLSSDLYRVGLLATFGFLEIAYERVSESISVKKQLGYQENGPLKEAIDLKSVLEHDLSLKQSE